MNQAALDKMLQGRAVLLVTQRFWGAMVYNLRLIEDDSIPTACTDGKSLRYNPPYILSLTAPQLRGLLAEEVSHIARMHHTRRQGREPRAWNEACFPGETPVLMADGSSRAIGDIKPGDMLWSPTGPSRALELINRGVRGTVSMEWMGGRFSCTPDHRFLSDTGFEHAETQGSWGYRNFFAETGGSGIRTRASQQVLYSRTFEADRGHVHERCAGSLQQEFESIEIPADERKDFFGVEYVGARNCLLSRDRGRGRYANNSGAPEPIWGRTNIPPEYHNLQHLDASAGLDERTGVLCHRSSERERATLLEVPTEWVRPETYSSSVTTISNRKEESLRPDIGFHIATGGTVEARARDGSYARDCRNLRLAERTNVRVGRTRRSDEVFDLVSEHHVFCAGGLIAHNCDLAISPDLKAGGFDISDPNGGMMYDPRFKGMSAEEIYAARQKEQGKKPGRGNARGEIMDAPGGEAGKEKAEMEAMTIVRSAYAMAKKHIGAGTLPADILSIVKDLDEPKVDWRRKLRNFAEDSAIRETDWRRPSKRSPFPIILPGKTSSAPAKAVIGLDWSGSTWGPPRQAFGGEIQAMLDERAVGEIVCVFFDTEVKKVERYEPGDVISLESTGNGGTAFGPTLKWIAENEPDASCIIFLTDLGGTDNQQIKPPGPPVMWCRVPGLRVTPPRFGEIIELDPHG